MRQGREVGPVGQRRAEGDDLLDVVRPALRQDLGQQASPAVPDQAYARPRLVRQLRHAAAEAREHALGVADVEDDPRQLALVADAAEPPVEDPKRPVAGQEPWDQEHRPAVASGHTATAKHRVLEQGRQLAEREGVPQPHEERS